MGERCATMATTWLASSAPSCTPGSKTGYLHQLLAGLVRTSLFALPAIRQPTLIVAATDDPIVPIANAHIMTRLLPMQRSTAIRAGHRPDH